MEDFMRSFYNFLISIIDSFYQSVIYDGRYHYILEGLFNRSEDTVDFSEDQ